MRRLLALPALVGLFVLGAATSQAGKKPCPGNSCHPQTTTAQTTTTTPTTTATVGWTVPASIPADCSIDTAAQLSAWLATVPDGQTARFTGGCYRLEAVVELDNRRLTIDGGGATFRSYTAPADQRPFFRAVGSTLTFTNLTLAGSYTAGGTLTDSLQHAHGFDLRGTHADIHGVTVKNVAGDCVYYGLGYDNTTRSSGSFTDSTCASVGRNGVSVTAGDNITVTGNTITASGLDGVDVEPNAVAGDWGSSNVTVTGNTISQAHLYVYSIIEQAPVTGQVFSGNQAAGRVFVGSAGGTVVRPSAVTVRSNTGTTSLVFAHVDGLAVSGNDGSVSVSDCTAVTS